MKCSIKGIVLEKFTKGSNGKSKQCIRLFQKGEKTNLDVIVSPTTFNLAKEGQNIELNQISIGVYNVNGSVGMYAKEIF